MKKNELLDRVTQLDPDQEYACLIWCTDDALDRAQERETPITREEADEVICQCEEHKDAEMGISWTTLDWFISDVIENREA